MKKTTLLSVILLFISVIVFSQSSMDYDETDYKYDKSEKKNETNLEISPGLMIYNGKEMSTVIVVDNGKSYAITDGVLNGSKKLMSNQEVEEKLSTLATANFKYSNSLILISDSKPYFIAIFKNNIKKTKETIIIPLVEENNYLKLNGFPVKKETVLGKTVIKILPEIKIFGTEYVGHLALLK